MARSRGTLRTSYKPFRAPLKIAVLTSWYTTESKSLSAIFFRCIKSIMKIAEPFDIWNSCTKGSGCSTAISCK